MVEGIKPKSLCEESGTKRDVHPAIRYLSDRLGRRQ